MRNSKDGNSSKADRAVVPPAELTLQLAEGRHTWTLGSQDLKVLPPQPPVSAGAVLKATCSYLKCGVTLKLLH